MNIIQDDFFGINGIKNISTKHLKYLSNNVDIVINNINKSTIKLINKIKKLNLKNRIIINETNELNDFLIDNNITGNIYIKTPFRILPLHEYLNYEIRLYKMLIPTENLSPFEKYIYIYNLVKNYKPYKNSENSLDSRDVYKILDNEYMVCTGFSELLGNLLKKVGINNTIYCKESINSSKNDYGHTRLLVNLEDPKYDIKGFYISDPTYDNDIHQDYYNHMLLTHKQADTIDTEYTVDDKDYILLSDNQQEFIDKINSTLPHNNNIITSLIISIHYLNPEKSKYFYTKYCKANNDKSYASLLFELSSYYMNNINNTIDNDTIYEGIKNTLTKTSNLSSKEINIHLNVIEYTNTFRNKIKTR